MQIVVHKAAITRVGIGIIAGHAQPVVQLHGKIGFQAIDAGGRHVADIGQVGGGDARHRRVLAGGLLVLPIGVEGGHVQAHALVGQVRLEAHFKVVGIFREEGALRIGDVQRAVETAGLGAARIAGINQQIIIGLVIQDQTRGPEFEAVAEVEHRDGAGATGREAGGGGGGAHRGIIGRARVGGVLPELHIFMLVTQFRRDAELVGHLIVHRAEAGIGLGVGFGDWISIGLRLVGIGGDREAGGRHETAIGVQRFVVVIEEAHQPLQLAGAGGLQPQFLAEIAEMAKG